jgi:hypothetical protein
VRLISEAQAKLLDLLAQSTMGTASIFFAILALLFGAFLTLKSDTSKRPIRRGLIGTYLFTVLSLVLASISMVAIRYRTVFSYKLTLWGTGLTIFGMFAVASFMLYRTISE